MTSPATYVEKPIQELEKAKYLRVLLPSSDVTGTTYHQELDEELQKVLQSDEAKESLMTRSPKTKDDYLAVVELVIRMSPQIRQRSDHRVTHFMESVRRDYLEAGEEVWAEFKRLVDICVEHRKFLAIRNLGTDYNSHQTHKLNFRTDIHPKRCSGKKGNTRHIPYTGMIMSEH